MEINRSYEILCSADEYKVLKALVRDYAAQFNWSAYEEGSRDLARTGDALYALLDGFGLDYPPEQEAGDAEEKGQAPPQPGR